MNLKQWAMFVSLAAVWGASFLFVKIAVGALGPFPLMVFRVSIAGGLLIIYAMFTKQSWWTLTRQNWRKFLMLGALNAAIPYVLIGYSQLHITASLGAILNSTAALFTALVAAIVLRESLNFGRIFGLVLGVIGVSILVGWSPLPMTTNVIIATIAALLSTLSYAFAGVYSASQFKNVPPMTVAIGQQLGATFILFPIGAIEMPDNLTLSPTIILATIGLASVSTAFAYILYFRLIEQVGPTKTLSVAYLIPVFGIIWGIVFLDETITIGTIIGLITILISVAMVNKLQFASTIQNSIRWLLNPKNSTPTSVAFEPEQ